MASIDLKQATIYIKDGFTHAGFLVNNMVGYTLGAVTMLIDGGTGILLNDTWFTVAGDTVEHKITSHSETLGNTTSVTFTPALGAMVADGAALTVLPHRLEIDVGEGTLQYTEKRNMEYKKSRGRLDSVREGDEEPVEVRLDIVWEFLRSISGATTPTPEEALKQVGAAAAWASSSSDPCEPYAVDLEIFYDPECSGEQSERIVLNDYRWESIEHDPKAGTLQTSGKANVTQATVTRVT